ncbi:ATP-dependent zinc metalloprotease FtsH [Paraburkholderia aromaticivorans]|uniref:ATP-dependent zinc metalloprotease FtsH n=1 Tax=Paraburkholderia aromaticivorans TaxID=2026199 RepID=UPI0038BB2E44
MMRKRSLNKALTTVAIAAALTCGGTAQAQSDSRDAASYAMPGGDGTEYALIYALMAQDESGIEMVYSDFVSHIDNGDVREVSIAGPNVTGKLRDGSKFHTTAAADPGMIGRILDHHVRVTVATDGGFAFTNGGLTNWLLMALIVTGIFFLTRRVASRGGGVATVAHSGAKLQASSLTTFADVAGIDEAEEELAEIVDYLKEPLKFQRLGGRVPKGVLLVGPPGTGKTLLARAVAGEAGVPFFSVSGSEFVEMYVGVGAARVRDMFSEGRKNAPCIIFIDEIDGVGRHRSIGLAGGNDEREQTVNQLLVEMDGFEANEGVIVLAATNRPDVLDAALLRPGRFDRQVEVPHPDVMGREKIFDVHMRKVPLGPEVDAKTLARGTPGFSGADIGNVVNEAALLATRHGHPHVTGADFEQAKDKVLMGAERRSLTLTYEERRLTAYHEAGHALVAFYSPGLDPLHKVSIVPRARALGVTISLPEHDRHSFSKKELESKVAMMFGGRVAEELIYGTDEVTTGASNDIRQATLLARRMVTEFGFSDTLGPVYCVSGDEAFPGSPGSSPVSVSPTTALAIDEDIRRVIERGQATARRILTGHLDQLRLFAHALLDREILSRDEIRVLLAETNLPGRLSLAEEA